MLQSQVRCPVQLPATLQYPSLFDIEASELRSVTTATPLGQRLPYQSYCAYYLVLIICSNVIGSHSPF